MHRLSSSSADVNRSNTAIRIQTYEKILYWAETGGAEDAIQRARHDLEALRDPPPRVAAAPLPAPPKEAPAKQPERRGPPP